MSASPSDAAEPLEGPPVPGVWWKRPWVHRMAMILVVVVVALVGRATGLWEAVSLDAIQDWTRSAGWLAIPLFVLLFVACNSLAVPGVLFVLGGLLAFGPVLGVPVVLVGAASAGTFATWWMRKVGGSPVGPPASPIARRIQKRLDDRPIAAVAMLRFFTRLAPPAHMLLALAEVSPLQNFLGTLVGFAPRVIVAAVFLEPVVAWFTER